MSTKAKRKSRMDTAIRRQVLESSPSVTFDEGTEKVLLLGCYLFLERLAEEARGNALEEKRIKVNDQDMKKAIKNVLADVDVGF